MNIHACLPNTMGYSTKALEQFFADAPRVYHTQLDYALDEIILRAKVVDEEAKGEHFLPVGLEPSLSIQKKIYQYGKDSKVGKGYRTVLDKSIRSSKEHTELLYEEKFLTYLRREVSKGLKTLKAGTLRSLTPHKLVAYSSGDHFSEHIDSLHTPNQTLTCVVVLSTDWENHGEYDFTIDGKGYQSLDGCMYLFHHDDKHRVEEVHSGFRLSLTFDLVVDPLAEIP